MRSVTEGRRVTGSDLGAAVVLLAGVLVIAYGYFHPSKIALYAGLFLTIAGVITGVIRIVLNGRGGQARA